MYPVRNDLFYPESVTPQIYYGLGTSWTKPDSRILTHGSATRSVLLIHLDSGLLVTMTRPTGGEHYDTYFNRILETIARFEDNLPPPSP